jgi:OmpA-OmpF porin, OOP family
MRRICILLPFLAGLLSSCAFGPISFPTGGGNGGQYPSDGRGTPRPSSSDPRPADPGVTVNNIRLTRDYTILTLTFTDKSRPQYDQQGRQVSTNTIEIDPEAQLVAANGARKFRFIKADDIPIKPNKVKTFPGDKVTFTLYFERLDKGLETFDLFECNDYDYIVCWNIYNLYVSNPADAVVYSPPPPAPTPEPTPVPKAPAPTTSTTKPPKTTKPLPKPSGQTGGETRVPKPVPAPTMVAVSGIVSDSKSKRPVTATINYQFSASKKSVDSVQSFASTGGYRMSLVKGQIYTYIASARGYQSASGTLDLTKAAGNQNFTQNIALIPLAVGDKIALKNIYFEMSKADLLAASFAELNQVTAMMTNNPNMTIRLEGHTDIIGDHAKNLQLSQDRVLACQRYLVQQGIDLSRVQTIGYGDTRPILTKGSDEERKVNRRVEFAVLSL